MDNLYMKYLSQKAVIASAAKQSVTLFDILNVLVFQVCLQIASLRSQ